MEKLNIIGCGNVGKTLGFLWFRNGIFKIQDILNRSLDSSKQSTDFIGAGNAVQSYKDLRPADVYLISASDNSIVECCDRMAEANILSAGNVVFHCCGAIVSDTLSSARKAGAFVASVHPVKSFADSAASISTFEGTFCGAEGDPEALEIINKAFRKIGAEIFEIDPRFKTIYHSASVMVSNYLVALLDVGTRAYMKAGIPRETVLKLMMPMVRGTVDNVFKFDTTKALTGPIARGDHAVVSQQLDELTEWNEKIGMLYKNLGSFALEISRSRKSAAPDDLAVLSALLDVD